METPGEGHSDIQKEVMRTCRRWTAVGFSTASYLVAWLGVSCSSFFFLRFFCCGLFSFFSCYLICYNIASIFLNVSFWPWGMWDLTSTTRDQTCTPCIGRRTLLHWIAREVPPCSSHHRSVLYRPAQAPMSAPSYMSLRQEMCALCFSVCRVLADELVIRYLIYFANNDLPHNPSGLKRPSWTQKCISLDQNIVLGEWG